MLMNSNRSLRLIIFAAILSLLTQAAGLLFGRGLAFAETIPANQASTAEIPTVPGDGAHVDVLYGSITGVPTEAALSGVSYMDSLITSVIDYPVNGDMITNKMNYQQFFLGAGIAPPSIASGRVDHGSLRIKAQLHVAQSLDRNPGTPGIDIRLGVASADSYNLIVGDTAVSQGLQMDFAWTWVDLTFEAPGLYPLTLLFHSDEIGHRGLNLRWTTANATDVTIPQASLYSSVPTYFHAVNFDDLPVGVVPSNQYESVGAHFQVHSGALEVTDTNPANFVPVSPTHVLGDPGASPVEQGEVELSFVVPGTTQPATTNRLSLYVIDAEAMGAQVTAFDALNTPLFSQTISSTAGSQTRVEINKPYIHHVTITLGQGEDTAAIDDVQIGPLLSFHRADLVVNTVGASPAATEGQPLSVHWTIKNQGNASAAAWADRVYLSENTTYEPSDVQLGQLASAGPLAPGALVERSLLALVPAGLSGDYHVIVVTDAQSAIDEQEAEGNNTGATSAVTSVTLRPPADLRVDSATLGSARHTWQPLSITWTTYNQGVEMAPSAWADQIYLSSDATLDVDDALVGQEIVVGGLPHLGSYTKSATIDLPGEPETYHLFIVVDASSAISDTDRSNNVIEQVIDVASPSYTATVQASVETAPAGTPVYLTGSAIDIASGLPAGDVDVELRLHVRGARRVIPVHTTANGTFDHLFQPLASEAGVYTVGAAHPAVSGDAAQDQFTLVGLSSLPKQASLKLTAGDSADKDVTLQNLGDAPLTNLSILSVLAPTGVTVEATPLSSLAALGSAPVTVHVVTNEGSAQSGSVSVTFGSAEGATATLDLQLTVATPYPSLSSTTNVLKAVMVPGEAREVQIDVSNTGGAPTGSLVVTLPEESWLSLVSPETRGPLAPGESAALVVRLAPPADLPLLVYSGSIGVSDGTTSLSLPFELQCASSAIADLRVVAVDEFTYYAEGEPKVSGATVKIRDPFTGELVQSSMTDAAGSSLFTGVTEGYYEIDVQAEDHGGFTTTVLVSAGGERVVTAFMPRRVVSYSWSVTPTFIDDQYHITIDTSFAANVPAPVITLSPPLLDLREMTSDDLQVDVTITNHGLITATSMTLDAASNEHYSVTPLVSSIGDLPGNASVTVPVLIHRNAAAGANLVGGMGGNKQKGGASAAINQGSDLGGGGHSCTKLRLTASWKLLCGKQWLYGTDLTFQSDGEVCPAKEGAVVAVTDPGIVIESNEDPEFQYSGRITARAPSSTESLPCSGCLMPCLDALKGCTINALIGVDTTLNCIAGNKLAYDSLTTDNSLRNVIVMIVDGIIVSCLPLPSILGPLQCACNAVDKCLLCDNAYAQFPCDAGSLYDRIVNPIYPENSGFPASMVKSASPVSAIAGSSTVGAGSSGAFTSSDPILSYFHEHYERMLTATEVVGEIFGSGVWMNTKMDEVPAFQAWVSSFIAATGDETAEGLAISAEERATLLPGRPSQTTEGDFNQFIDRWNRTVSYWSAGIHEVSQVPPGQSSDFIDREELMKRAARLAQVIEAGEDEGYDSPYEGLRESFTILNTTRHELDQGVCADVRIELSQDAVLTRAAFLADLQLENHGSLGSMTTVAVNIEIIDENGQNASDRFTIAAPELANISDVSGGGVISEGQVATARWTLIPTDLAAPAGPTLYRVSGHLEYTLDGQFTTIPLFPTSISVLPNPSLSFTYFMEKQVFGDDPFSPALEPSVPFSLGLIVTNTGVGTAQNVRVTSSQPEITDNEHGLLLDFDLIGTQVGSTSVSPSLNVSLGDLGPGASTTIRWLMTSSLMGKFTRYEASLDHIDGLGDLRPSLVHNVDIKEMIHVVRLGGNNDDHLPDFLVNDVPDTDLLGLPDRLYRSDGSIDDVTPITDTTTLIDSFSAATPPPCGPDDTVLQGGSCLRSTYEAHVYAAMASGWCYLRTPGMGKPLYRLHRAFREDGTELAIGDDAWQTKRWVRPADEPAYLEDFVHIFDACSGGTHEFQLIYKLALRVPDALEFGAPTATTVPLTRVSGNDDNTLIFIRECTTGLFVQGDGALAYVPFTQAQSAWEGTVLHGLMPGTAYQFCAQARSMPFGAGGTATDHSAPATVVTLGQ